MSTSPNQLANFERRILDEVKQVVTARAATEPAVPGRDPARPGRRLLLGLTGASAAVALAVGISATIGMGEPASAVERDPDGSLRIYIREYRDPQGLQRKLEAHGVNAAVDFIPNGTQCREPRAVYDTEADLRYLLTPEEDADGEGYWKLHTDLIPPGRTFIYTMQIFGEPERGRVGTAGARFNLAIGYVAPCEVVPGGPVLGPGGG